MKKEIRESENQISIRKGQVLIQVTGDDEEIEFFALHYGSRESMAILLNAEEAEKIYNMIGKFLKETV